MHYISFLHVGCELPVTPGGGGRGPHPQQSLTFSLLNVSHEPGLADLKNTGILPGVSPSMDPPLLLAPHARLPGYPEPLT